MIEGSSGQVVQGAAVQAEVSGVATEGSRLTSEFGQVFIMANVSDSSEMKYVV